MVRIITPTQTESIKVKQTKCLSTEKTWKVVPNHYNDIIMRVMASKITSLTIIYSNVYSGADKKKHQSSASLAFLWGIHRRPVNSPHKGPVTRGKCFHLMTSSWPWLSYSQIHPYHISVCVINCGGYVDWGYFRCSCIENPITCNFSSLEVFFFFICGKKNTSKLDKLQERALRLVFWDKTATYDTLLKRGNFLSLKAFRTRCLAAEVYKCVHGLDPTYLNDILSEPFGKLQF